MANETVLRYFGAPGICCDINGDIWHKPGDCRLCGYEQVLAPTVGNLLAMIENRDPPAAPTRVDEPQAGETTIDTKVGMFLPLDRYNAMHQLLALVPALQRELQHSPYSAIERDELRWLSAQAAGTLHLEDGWLFIGPDESRHDYPIAECRRRGHPALGKANSRGRFDICPSCGAMRLRVDPAAVPPSASPERPGAEPPTEACPDCDGIGQYNLQFGGIADCERCDKTGRILVVPPLSPERERAQDMTALEEHQYDVIAALRKELDRIHKSARVLKLEDVLAHSAETSETINDLRAFNIAAQLRIAITTLETRLKDAERERDEARLIAEHFASRDAEDPEPWWPSDYVNDHKIIASWPPRRRSDRT